MRTSATVFMPLPLALTTQDATLIAAGIAAAAALLKLVADAVSARGAATRAAHRSTLEPHLGQLGKGIHEVTAGVVLTHRRVKQGQAPGNARVNAERAAQQLKDKRLEVKYALDGTDEALRVLTRAPNWVATYQGDTSGDALVAKMQRLSKHLDDVIGRSYRRGRPPTYVERKRLERAASQTRETWERRFGRETDT
jgi:hypothetical protein